MKRMMKHLAPVLIASLVFSAFSFFISLFCPAYGKADIQLDAGMGSWVIPVSILITIIIPLALAWLSFLLSARWAWHSSQSESADPAVPGVERRKQLPLGIKILFLLWLATWLFGAPSVQTSIHRTTDQYFAEAVKSGRSWSNLPEHIRPKGSITPHIATPICFPILPLCLLAYHEYQVGPLWGWGGWELHAWYVVGEVRLFSFMVWIS
jgi:hypothetical protein